MSGEVFSRGDRVYGADGNEYVYVCAHGSEHLACQVFQHDALGQESEEVIGHPIVLSRVFASPILPVVDEAVAKKRAELLDLTVQVTRTRQELKAAETEHAALVKKLRQIPALRRIEDYLDGKFKFFVAFAENYGKPSIKSAEEALRSEDRDIYWEKGLKLLTLFGDTKGDLLWRINHYRDGSGSSNVVVYPCETREEAVALLQKLYDEAVVEWRNASPEKNNSRKRAVEWAGADDISVPDDVAAFIRKIRRASHEAAVERARRDLTAAEANLRNFDSIAAANTGSG